MPTQKINFSKGMDKDTEPRLLESGAYRDALNLEFVSQNIDGSDYSGEGILGTTQITAPTISGLSNPLVIGSYDNKLKRSVYYMVCSTGHASGHSILEYNYESLVITTLLTTSLLGFDEDYPISGITMVGDMLFWTSGDGEPMYVDVEKLRNGEYPSSIAKSNLTLIRPLAPDLAVRESILTSIETAIAPIQSYQFAVQFQYMNYQWSKPSGYSYLPVKESKASYLEVTVPLGDETVISVRLLFRLKPTDLTASDWYIYGTYYPTTSEFASSLGDRYVEGYQNVTSDSIRVNFYNSSIYNTLEVNEGAALFDFIPRDAKALTQIDGSRIVLANGVTGFDLPQSNTSAEVKYNSIPATIDTDIAQTDSGSGAGYVYNEYTVNAIRSGETIYANLVFSIGSAGDPSLDYVKSFGFPDKNLFETGVRVLTLTTDSLTTIAEKIVAEINAIGGVARISNSAGTDESFETAFNAVVTGADTFEIRRYTMTPFADTYTLAYSTAGFVGETDRPVSVFKSGMEQETGLIYYDDYGRSSTVLADDYVVAVDPIASSNSGSNYIEYTINHIPPTWASKYRVALKQKQYYSIIIKAGTVSSNTISLQELVDYNAANSNSVLSYDWVSGDRVRRVYDDSANAFFSSTDDVEIKKYDSGALTIETESSLSITTGDWIEIYRPAKAIEGTSEVYANITQAYDIVGGYHMGDVQDQTASLPAILNLVNGNAYRRNRTMNSETVYIEDSNMTDDSLTSGTSAGKPNLTDISASEKREESTVWWSESFIANTQVNGLSSFFGVNFRDANKAYGGIYKLHSSGFRLFVYQELHTSFTLINKAMFNDFNGNSIVGQSTAVMQDFDYYEAEYGIGKYPHSFAFNGDNIYFCDPLRGVIIRHNQAGLVPISPNGLKQFSRLYLNSIQEQSTFNELDLIGTFDIYGDKYILTFKSPIKINGTCTALQSTSEPKTRFTITLQDGYADFFEVSDNVLLLYQNSSNRYEQTDAIVISKTANSVTLDSDVIASLATPPFNVLIKVESNKTVGFHEASNSFKSFYSFVPDYYAQAGVGIVSFIDQHVQRHGVNLTRNNFYGVQYDSELTFIANNEYITPKSFLGIELYANDTCDVELSNNMSQESSLLTTDFERYEDYYYSNFLCDANTPNVTDPLLNGDNLRSNHLVVKLTNSSTSGFRILLAGIRYIVSKFVQ